jgi:hypothetical protein
MLRISNSHDILYANKFTFLRCAMPEKITSFADFWPYYLREHAQPMTRALHYIGTTLVVGLGLYALFSGRYWFFAAMPFAGYGFAWISHMLVERNRPATFTYPRWSLAADFKMWALWLTGRLGPHLDAAGISGHESA